MNYKDLNKDHSYWNDDASLLADNKGVYISVSGNTGAGKSTLINAIGDYVVNKGHTGVKIINERVLHHPLLKLMFAKPGEYAFLIQLNFLLQRTSILKRWLSLGYVVVIERSHLDDSLFIEHHFNENHIDEIEFDLYRNLSKKLFEANLRPPDLMILLTVPAETSMNRISYAESIGERPYEFPDDGVKKDFVFSWHKKYEQYFQSLLANEQLKNNIFHFNNSTTLDEAMTLISPKINKALNDRLL